MPTESFFRLVVIDLDSRQARGGPGHNESPTFRRGFVLFLFISFYSSLRQAPVLGLAIPLCMDDEACGILAGWAFRTQPNDRIFGIKKSQIVLVTIDDLKAVVMGRQIEAFLC